MHKRFIIAAGGTGGHVYQAIALIEYMIEQKDESLILCDDRTQSMIEKESMPYKVLPLSRPSQRIKFWFNIIRSFVASYREIKKFKPDGVIGFGGYPTFPVLLAALFARIPIFLHEQNTIMGKVNSIFSHVARLCAVPVIENYNIKNAIMCSSLLRKKIKQHKNNNRDFHNKNLKVCVLGGSQGASIFAKILPKALSYLEQEMLQDLEITHQANVKDLELLKNKYDKLGVKCNIQTFFDNPGELLNQNHLLISRAGASTVAEAYYFNIPTIFVPMPSYDNHQFFNAVYASTKFGAIIIPEDDVAKIIKILNTILKTMIVDRKELERLAAIKHNDEPEQDSIEIFYNAIIDNLHE